MTQLDRIRRMETVLTELTAALRDSLCTPETYHSLLPLADELAAYYEGPLWRRDFEDDCAGRLPADLKRGVLSEDAAYNVLSDFDELRRKYGHCAPAKPARRKPSALPPIYFAPLEGVTDTIFRRVHHAHFTGVTKYYIPFVSPTKNMFFTARELYAISPEGNAGIPVVPQIMAKDAELFLWCAGELKAMGYTEVNLNIGCPSGTVTAKGKGSGMLRTPDVLAAFLDEIFEKSPLPISVKTRIGFESDAEWPRLLSILASYPIHELTVHPRTRTQFYTGVPYKNRFDETFDRISCPIVYNGNLFTLEDCEEIAADCPDTAAIMLGRGLIGNPALAQQMTGGEGLTLDSLKRFHDDLLDAYLERGPENFALVRMTAIMKHLLSGFADNDKPRKLFRKATTVSAYREAAALLFECHELTENPHFLPDPSAIH